MDGQLLPVALLRTVKTVRTIGSLSSRFRIDRNTQRRDTKFENRVEIVVALTQSGQRGRHFLARCISVSRRCEVSDVERPAGRCTSRCTASPLRPPISSQRLSSSNLLLDREEGIQAPLTFLLLAFHLSPRASLSDPTSFLACDSSLNFSLLRFLFFFFFLPLDFSCSLNPSPNFSSFSLFEFFSFFSSLFSAP